MAANPRQRGLARARKQMAEVKRLEREEKKAMKKVAKETAKAKAAGQKSIFRGAGGVGGGIPEMFVVPGKRVKRKRMF